MHSVSRQDTHSSPTRVVVVVVVVEIEDEVTEWTLIQNTHTLVFPFPKLNFIASESMTRRDFYFYSFFIFFFLWCLIFVNESTVELLMLLVVQ